MPTPLSAERRLRICQRVEQSFEQRQVPWLAELVELPSHTLARDDVEAAARHVDALANELGLQRRLVPDPSGRFADHRVYAPAELTDDDPAPALVGHCDTVFPRSQGFLKFQRDSDVIRGPGTLDMKSGLSVVLFAVFALREAEPASFERLRFRFVCNTDEEVGSPSSRVIYEQIAQHTTFALVFEGGRAEDRIITARKGSATFEVEVVGREAHAGNHHAEGLNAIHALAYLIPRIEALTDYERGTLVNVGLVQGGTAKNTVPGRAHCVVDARVSTEAEALRVTSELEALAREPFAGALGNDMPDKLRKARVELSGEFRRKPMEATADSRALMARYAQYARQVGLGSEEAAQQGGGSDANLLAAHGVPVIDGLGPYGEHFHSVKEYSVLPSLLRKTQALACFLAASA